MDYDHLLFYYTFLVNRLASGRQGWQMMREIILKSAPYVIFFLLVAKEQW